MPQTPTTLLTRRPAAATLTLALAVLLTGAALLALRPPAAYADTIITVNTTADEYGSGASCSLNAQPSPDPVLVGIQRSGMMPLPKNQVPKRSGSGVPSAYAVPLSFSIPKSRGSGTATLMPPTRTPRRKVRRGRIVRLLRAMLSSLCSVRRSEMSCC